jgi:hypothetical protein
MSRQDFLHIIQAIYTQHLETKSLLVLMTICKVDYQNRNYFKEALFELIESNKLVILPCPTITHLPSDLKICFNSFPKQNFSQPTEYTILKEWFQ